MKRHHEHHCGCGCESPSDVPEPCWVPKRLSDVGGVGRPGQHVRLRVRITNDADRAQTFTAAGSDPGMTVTPAALTLGPLERGILRLELKIPPGASLHYLETCVVTVTGCSAYRFRWFVGVAPWRVLHALRCRVAPWELFEAAHVRIIERRDYEHHWYDHFFCDGPCPSTLVV
jgi:hypothetical protein